MYTPLLIIITVIFALTALLTLCALPGWIKIPDNYLKILFSSLILEVIAFVFVFVKSGDPDKDIKSRLSYQDNDWILLKDDGEIMKLCVDSTNALSMTEQGFSNKVRNSEIFNLVKNNGQYFVMNKDNYCIGKIKNNIIKDSLKLFDQIILKPDTYTKINYIKDGNDWKLNESSYLNEEWDIKINIKDSKYYIQDNKDNIRGSGGLNKNSRPLHSFQGSDAFYLAFISEANYSNPDKPFFINFIVIRTEIESKLNN